MRSATGRLAAVGRGFQDPQELRVEAVAALANEPDLYGFTRQHVGDVQRPGCPADIDDGTARAAGIDAFDMNRDRLG